MARKAPPPSHGKKHGAPHTKHSAPKRDRKGVRSMPQKGAIIGALAGLGSLIASQFM